MLIETTIDGVIATITLNHPARRNALGLGLIQEILDALADFKSRKIRVVILRANAEAKVWSAGHDINELPIGQDPLRFGDPLERLLREIAGFPAPVIAMVHGSVWGGATDLVLTCDLVVGDETSSFAMTAARLGLPYNTAGLLHFQRRLPLNLVKEMFFTAQPIGAESAAKWGILNHLVASADLESFTIGLASEIATKAPLVLASVKEQLKLLTEAVALSPEIFERIQGLRETVYKSNDYQEGIRAFHEKRVPQFRGE